MVIGEGRGCLELESGFFFEERHCLRTMSQEGIHAFGIEIVARLVLKISPRRFWAVLHAIPLRHGIARDPHEAARKRGGSPDVAVFFSDDDLQAMQSGNRRRGQAARAGAGYQDITAYRLGPAHRIRFLLLLVHPHGMRQCVGIPRRFGRPSRAPVPGAHQAVR